MYSKSRVTHHVDIYKDEDNEVQLLTAPVIYLDISTLPGKDADLVSQSGGFYAAARTCMHGVD